MSLLPLSRPRFPMTRVDDHLCVSIPFRDPKKRFDPRASLRMERQRVLVVHIPLHSILRTLSKRTAHPSPISNHFLHILFRHANDCDAFLVVVENPMLPMVRID